MLESKPAGVEEGSASTDFVREPAFPLGGMQVSPSSRELLVDGGILMLQPRIMQVLVALAQRRGEVVSRDELVHLCWGGRAVSEDAINRCIQAIRRIAKEHGGFAVKTIARVGYRLVETSPPLDSGLVTLAGALPGRGRLRRRRFGETGP